MSNWIPKIWGGELIFADNELYCGKILEVKKGHFSSFHRHKKVEDWLIYSGKILLLHSFHPLLQKRSKDIGLRVGGAYGEDVILNGVEYKSEEKGLLTQTLLRKSDTKHIPSLEWHLFYALEDSQIIEVSTPDEESERLTESY